MNPDPNSILTLTARFVHFSHFTPKIQVRR